METQDIMKKAVEAFNRHDAAAFAGLYAAEATSIDPQYTQPLQGRAAIQKDVEDWLRAFPDVQVKVLGVMADGDMVAAELEMSGTHKGPIASPAGAIPATNKRFETRFAWFAQVDGRGLIREDRRYYDMAGLAQQLGVG